MVTIPQALHKALQHHKAGQLVDAERLYKHVLSVDPNQVDALHLLGLVCHATGRFDDAIKLMNKAVKIKPDFAEAHFNRAKALAEQGRHDEAETSYRQAIQVRPDYPDAYFNLGNLYRDRGKSKEAIASFRKAIAARPNYVKALINLGSLLQETGHNEEAIKVLNHAVSLEPELPAAQYSLGRTLQEAKRPAEAAARYEELLRHQPTMLNARYNLGKALQDMGKLDQAMEQYELAFKFDNNDPDLWNGKGSVLYSWGKGEEALQAFEEALKIRPDFPRARANYAMTLLRMGRFDEGFKEFNRRWECKDFRRNDYPKSEWDGSSLRGRTILLYAEQGIGDTIQFIRFASQVQQLGGRVVVEAPIKLTSLLESCPGVEQVVATDTILPPFDVRCGLLSLPGLLGTTSASIPARIPYLKPPADRVALWKNELSPLGELRVGIVWQGNPDFGGDLYRSVKALEFEPLGRIPGVRLISLQKGPGSEQLAELQARIPIIDLAEQMEPDFAESAAIVRNLDLVICVDTAAAHLAGALGVPVWVAIPAGPDWRWQLKREDSPWYPTMRLFRQERLLDWAPVFARIAEELQKRAQAKRS